VSALAEEGGVQPPQEPLGTLLVKRGLITAEQLTDALAEQKSTGQPLGAIVVARGFAAPATIAQALATQHGGILKTEYGFATGFGEGLRPNLQIGEPPVSSRRIGKPKSSDSAVALVAPSTPDPAGDREAVREELAMASSETERLTEANNRLVELRSELEQRLAHETTRAATLEATIVELRTQAEAAAPGECAERVAQLEAAVSELHAGAVAWEKAYGELEQRLAQTESARAELEQSLAHEVDRSATLRAELETVEDRRVSAESSDSVRIELEERLAQVSERASALEAEVAAGEELRATAAASESARAELEERLQQASEQLRSADAVRAELEERLARAMEGASELEASIESAEQLRASVLASEQARAGLEQQLEAIQSELSTRNQELAELRATAAAGPWAFAQKHLVFFPGAEGYELVERDGPPPSAGTRIGEHVVARIAAGVLPGDLPCAYLAG
jgi:DNA repair exonuclease SbcCD ATPase subunit